MAARNAEAHIEEAVQSILAQTHEDLELVVVDDASTDATPRIVRSHRDPQVQLTCLPSNVGAAAARNHGIRSCRAAMVAVLDADDVAYPERLERQLAFMERNPQCALLGTAYDVIDDSGALQSTARPVCHTAEIRWMLLTRNPIANSATMFRKRNVLAVGGYDVRFRAGHDYAL